MRITAAGLSDFGTQRDANDDHYCVASFVEQGAMLSMAFEPESMLFQEFGLLACVADGLGGYEGGMQASQLLLQALSVHFYSDPRRGATAEQLKDALTTHIGLAQQELAAELAREPRWHQAGTTLAGVALMPPDILCVFHCGDSRVLRATGGHLLQLTTDHTPIGQALAAGQITEEQAAAANMDISLKSSLGLAGTAEVEINCDLRWAAGDKFLIGSDGWHGVGRGLSRKAIQDVMRHGGTSSALTQCLLAVSVANDGKDNATLVIVQVEES
jgi:protein phosphatase